MHSLDEEEELALKRGFQKLSAHVILLSTRYPFVFFPPPLPSPPLPRLVFTTCHTIQDSVYRGEFQQGVKAFRNNDDTEWVSFCENQVGI